jgi:hypothetical protein
MLAILDRISNRTAYIAMAAGIGVSLIAAFLAPQDVELGAWVRLTIWHGMLKWACIVGIFGMGLVALLFMITKRDKLYDWARAMQVALLPLWVFAVVIGVMAAKLVWGSFNLAERRMTMSLAYILVAGVALMLSLFWENRRAGTIGQIVTALAMGVGLWWVSQPPGINDVPDVHPAAAVMNSGDPAFQIAAFFMMAGCLVWVVATAVPVRRWLEHVAEEHAAHDAAEVALPPSE